MPWNLCWHYRRAIPEKDTVREQERRKRVIKTGKERRRERCEETWAFQRVTFDFLTFWLTVLPTSPRWWTELSRLRAVNPNLALWFGILIFTLLFISWQRETAIFLALKKASLIQLHLTVIIPLRPNLLSYFLLGNLLTDKDWFFFSFFFQRWYLCYMIASSKKMRITWKWSEGNKGIREMGYERQFSCPLPSCVQRREE